jgi:hypothetical protein
MGRTLACALLLAGLACSSDSSPVQPPLPAPTPSPTPAPPPGVTIGPATGPTQIFFSAAQPPPGATFTGCGADMRGCEGRLRLRFVLRPSGSGHVLRFTVFLHDTRMQACLFHSTQPFDLRAGTETGIDLVLDGSDACRMPATIATMAAVVEGTVEVASRQEWGVTYTFQPF